MAMKMTRRKLMTGAALTAGGSVLSAIAQAATDQNGISRSAVSIHQEPLIDAAPQRIYQALMDPKQFDRIAKMSEAMQAADMQKLMQLHPSRIGQHAGEPFALFGGYIAGRHIKLVANELIVQAWRAGSWAADDYSIARFKLMASGSGTKIVFDHTGFPSDQADHLAAGWQANYWGPLVKVLA
jgi:activator of HSP90 ATPase